MKHLPGADEATSALAAIAPATNAAIDETRMSRFLMCPNSCASTLLTWSGGRCCSNPSVTATAACCVLRPVANAFGCSDGMVYSRGRGHLGAPRQVLHHRLELGH